MAQAAIPRSISPLTTTKNSNDTNRKRSRKQSQPLTVVKTENEEFHPSEYFISVNDKARIIVRASSRTRDGVEIRLQASQKRSSSEACDYETWLAAVKLTNVVAMARDQILEHNPPPPLKSKKTSSQPSVVPGQSPTEVAYVSGSFIDQIEELDVLKQQLDSLDY